MHLLLRHATAGSLRVDLDLLLGVLDLAATHGWKPRLTSAPDLGLQLRHQQPGARLYTPSAYFLPCGQRIGALDGRELSESAKRGLDRVSKSEVPLTDAAFGEDHTLGLIEHAAKESPRSAAEARGAMEVLSGAPSAEAAKLVAFLRRGETRVLPSARTAGREG